MAVGVGKTPNVDNVVFLRVSWEAYASFVAGLGDDSHARLTYDGARLEIMSPGSKHERLAEQIGELVSAVMSEWAVNIVGTGSTTLQKPGESGAEPDKSYHVASAAKVRDFDAIDLAIDPPPDLVIEIDITDIRDDKRKSFATLEVPEFWRYRREELEAFALSASGYVGIAVSGVIPGLPIAEVEKRWHRPGSRLDIITEWRDWLRANRHLHTPK